MRLDPTGSVLTSHHVALVKLLQSTDQVEPALPLLEKSIVFYPGAKASSEERVLCDRELPPIEYITVGSGMTNSLNSADVLQYDLLRGLCFISQRMWQPALQALERVITYPTRDSHSCHKAMMEAHNKWVLVSLLQTGKMPMLPATTSAGAQKSFAASCKPYQAIGKAFEEKTGHTLKTEFESNGAAFFAEENNLELMRLVLQHYQRWQILNLQHVYTKISLEKIRARTESAETAAPLETVAEVEKLVQEMIDDGMLKGAIVRPADGAAPVNLVFHEPSEELSETEFAHKMLVTAQRLKDLEPLIRATNERLVTHRDYVRYMLGQQKREKDGRRDFDMSFVSQVEDEDLMTGVMTDF